MKAREIGLSELRTCQTLQQQVIEAEGDIKSGIPVPGRFRIEDDRPFRSNENVLRTEIAMHQRDLCRQGLLREMVQGIGNGGTLPCGFEQVRLHPQGIERLARSEFRSDLRVLSAC